MCHPRNITKQLITLRSVHKRIDSYYLCSTKVHKGCTLKKRHMDPGHEGLQDGYHWLMEWNRKIKYWTSKS